MQTYKFDVIDEATIKASPSAVYNAIVDVYDGKQNWWMPYVSSILVEGSSSAAPNSLSKVTILGIYKIAFISKTVEVQTNEMIRLHYTKGAFKGEGLWEFKQTNNETTVSFRWRANPSGLMLKIIALFYPLAKGHSAVMQKGFKNLKRLLEDGN